MLVPGSGTSSRHGCGWDRTSDATGLGTTPSETENTEADADGVESPCSDAAQQLSASLCVTRVFEPGLGESDSCIGHAPSPQHAMRASGVAAHPPQTATWPERSARMSVTAEHCWLKITTYLECSTAATVSNSNPLGRAVPSLRFTVPQASVSGWRHPVARLPAIARSISPARSAADTRLRNASPPGPARRLCRATP